VRGVKLEGPADYLMPPLSDAPSSGWQLKLLDGLLASWLAGWRCGITLEGQ